LGVLQTRRTCSIKGNGPRLGPPEAVPTGRSFTRVTGLTTAPSFA
jgi:hypothetical protein